MEFSAALTVIWALLAVGAVAFVICLLCHKHVQTALTVTVFALAAALFYPVVTGEYPSMSWLHKLFLSGYKALGLFLLNGNYQDILGALAAAGETVSAQVAARYQNVALVLYFAAPITTATMIASYFKSFTDYLRLHTVSRFTGLSVFSELNGKSLALAKSIRRKHILRTVIFCDVYRTNSEKQTELLEEARKLGALCFKKDILHLPYRAFAGMKEYFIIGANESENVEQTVRLTQRSKKRKNTRIYVWARGPESSCIFDSLPLYDEKTLEKNIITDPKAFKLRRIDDVEIFVWNTLHEAQLFSEDTCVPAGEQKLLSVLLIGMGDYGMAFLKALLWMYQRDDVRLEVNVVDTRDNVRDHLQHQCPELLAMNDCQAPGEAHYSIRFLESTDIFGGSFDERLLSEDSEIGQRLRRTTAVFVTLGDDDTNIRAALELRQLFDRVHFAHQLQQAEKAWQQLPEGGDKKPKQVGAMLKQNTAALAVPRIYTPVYDTVKTANITMESSAAGLRTYENIPYNIHFLGSFAQQYRYDAITRTQLEETALAYHLQWVSKEEDLPKNIAAYGQYEYYRRSSMAQAIYKTMLEQQLPLKCHKKGAQEGMDDLKNRQSCQCAACLRQRLVEHMRWNAYMRTEGYSLSPAEDDYKVKLPRAKLHCDLVEFDQLDELTQLKDSTLVQK